MLGAAWTLVEALAGHERSRAILSGAERRAPGELIDELAEALAAVHRMPADAALAPAVEDPLAQLRALHDHLGEPHPAFELAFRTLGPDRPPARTHARARRLPHGQPDGRRRPR